MKRPLGCMTPSGILTALFAVAAITGAALATDNAIFCPGELNAKAGSQLGGASSHSELERDCAACHPAFWESEHMQDHCLDCHENILAQMSQIGSLHADLTKDHSCQDCHKEHNGSMADLTVYTRLGYAHDTVGFSLKGHRSADSFPTRECPACHEPSVYEFQTDQCLDCHLERDRGYMVAHRATFQDECLNCHDGLDTYGAGFDHQALPFPLVGEHASVPCGGCHPVSYTVEALQETPSFCAACHLVDNIHTVHLGRACEACHNPSGWREATIDHALTGFPLVQSHADLLCDRCHQETDSWLDVPRSCYGCHAQEDIHEGALGIACADCHQASAWEESTFDHLQSQFPLTGAHQELPCSDCHAEPTFVGIPQDCYSCHMDDDPHEGRFGTDCGACHETAAWDEDVFDHSLSDFPLTGAHALLPCESCHVDKVYRGTSSYCADCHGQPSYHAGVLGDNCAACHNVSSWLPASYNGPHSFPYRHGGGSGSCRTCHPNRLSSYTCYRCHEHSQSEIREEHDDVVNLSNCVRCHPSGREGDD